MKLRRFAFAISGAASVGVHVLGLVALVWVPRIHLPEMPIPVEVRPSHRSVEKIAPPAAGDPRAAREKVAPPAKPVPPHAQKKDPAATVAKHAPAPAPTAPVLPPPPPPPSTTDLRPFAPGDAKVVVIVRGDRLRLSPHRLVAEQLLEALPDYHTLLGGTGLSAIDDFQALLIASSNPVDVTATFLAARHANDPRLRAALLHRTIPAWDPRQIRFLSNELSVLARPGDRFAMDAHPLGPDAGIDDTAARWVAELDHFDKIADVPNGPSLLVSISDLPSLVRFQTGLPTPLTVSLAATTDASPAVRVRCEFASEAEAQAFEAEWPAILRRFRESVQLFSLDALLDGMELKREGAVVEVAGRIREVLARRALSWVTALLPRHVYVEDPPADAGVSPPTATQQIPAVPPITAPQQSAATGSTLIVAPQQSNPAASAAGRTVLPARPRPPPSDAPHSPVDSGVR